jgi:O-methyltransferase
LPPRPRKAVPDLRQIPVAFGLAYRRFVRGDKQSGFLLARGLGRILYPGYRFIDPRIDWWHCPAFDAYLDKFGERDKLNCDRRFMVYQLARLAVGVPGDTAEAGVYQGAASWLICEASKETGKTHWAFDSFEGMSAPGPNDGSYWAPGRMACDEATVAANLAAHQRVRLMRGWIPSRFGEVADRVFSFVHVDVDLEAPTDQSIRFFYPRMSPGGVLLCDDYAFQTCPGATAAIDAYLRDKPERMVKLPGGGGFLIRGMRTAGDTFMPTGA